MHEESLEGDLTAARTTAAWLAYGRRTQPRSRLRWDGKEVAAYAGTLAIMALGIAAYLFA